MRKSRWFLLLAGAVLLVGAAAVPAATGAAAAIEVGTVLDAKQEVPKPSGAKVGAAGLFSGTIKGGKITWRMTFTKLTGAATGGAHIHLGAGGKAGDVAVALCGPCRSGQTGSAAIPAAAVAAIKGGRAYVNVHTGKNAAGEIRGQLVVVG
jgi:hypothetical protein